MAMKKSKIEMKRINMNIPVSLYDKVCDYAENLGINTTSAFIVLLNQSLNNDSMMNLLPDMFKFMNDIQSGKITEDTISNAEEINNKVLEIKADTDNIL